MAAPPLLVRATSTPSALGLVAANLVPLVGVLVFDWSLFAVIAVYWLENGVIGAFAVLRILLAGDTDGAASKAFLAPFFVVHYGGFWLGHGVFLVSLFGDGGGLGAGPTLGAGAVAGLALSHGASFVLNYLAGGERATATPTLEMFRPYGRVVLLHVVILVGGMLIDAFGAPTAALALFVGMKTALDLGVHLVGHGRRYGELAVAAPDPERTTLRVAAAPPSLRR